MAVLDASVLVDLVAPDVASDGAVRILVERLIAEDEEIHAPRLVFEEVLNALLTGIRRGRWDGAAADRAASLFQQLPVLAMDDTGDRHRAFELARRYDNWPLYDMVYVALAERLGGHLYTADARLRRRLAHLDWVRAPG